MKFLVFALFLAVALVNAEEEIEDVEDAGAPEDYEEGASAEKVEKWKTKMADFKEDMKNSPCYPVFQKFEEKEEECKDYTSAIATKEEIMEEMEKVMEKFGKGKGGKEGGKGGKHGKGGKGGKRGCGKMIEEKLCAAEKLGLIDPATKSIVEEKYKDLMAELPDEIRTPLTEALAECVKETDTKLPFITQMKCFMRKTMKVCATEKQKEMFKKMKERRGKGKSEEE